MARLISTITVDMSGMEPAFAMMRSLGDALATAHFDGELPIETTHSGICYRGDCIAKTLFGAISNGRLPMRAVPTFYLPGFAAAICRQVSGVKVKWCGGWPRFSADDWDDDTEDDPAPHAPEGLALA